MGRPFGFTLPTRTVPTPKSQLKSFNWIKLPLVKLQHTIWSELNEENAHALLDHAAIETNFSAYQRATQLQKEELDAVPAKKEITVIDGRRAQNCTIILVNIKMTNRQIHHAILSLDEDRAMSNDIIEQMMKYVPTAEEIGMLSELAEQANLFAAADRFMWEMHQIPRYCVGLERRICCFPRLAKQDAPCDLTVLPKVCAGLGIRF